MNKKKTRINLLLEIILWLVSIVTIYPMLMVLLTSFKNKGEAAYMNISLPSEWHPENYIAVLEKDFMRSLGNSVFITFISVALIVSLSAFLSFIIVRRDTKGCRIGYKIITLGIIAPFAALPTIQLMQNWSLFCVFFSVYAIYNDDVQWIYQRNPERVGRGSGYGWSSGWKAFLHSDPATFEAGPCNNRCSEFYVGME